MMLPEAPPTARKAGLCLVGFLLLGLTMEAKAQDKDQAGDEETILVVAERPSTSTADQDIRDKDLTYFPKRTASDLLRLLPGLHASQHTGGAKAHQIFLRGFDAEHGQDLAVSLDGIPINEVSHVHGQGYLDLHFLIPEAVQRIRVAKGPYDPRWGNFSTAGTLRFETGPRQGDTARLRVGQGMFKQRSGLAEFHFGDERDGAYFAFQAESGEGFTDPGDLAAGRAFVHARATDGAWRLDTLAASYAARSRATDTLPLDWIKAGRIGRFQALDDSNRVDVDRHLLGLILEGPAAGGRLKVLGHYQFKDTRIFSNYTYFYYHPQRGDQIEQSDQRHFGGLEAAYKRSDDVPGLGPLVTELGLQWRLDAVWQTQANTVERVRFDVLNHYAFLEHGLGAYAATTWLLSDRLQLQAGLRYDVQLLSIDGFQDVQELDIRTNQVVTRNDQPREAFAHGHALSPKLSLVYQAAADWRLFANAGRGFVTRPARDQANRPDAWAYAVTGAELGSRFTIEDKSLSVASALWWTHKERELVFDSEFGGTVFRGHSHRFGLELELRWAPLEWMWLGTDFFLTLARLHADEGWVPMPNTPCLLMSNAIGIQHPIGLHASLRGRLIGPRSHDLGLESKATYILDLVLAWEARHWGLVLEVENLLDAEWYDAVFAYPTRPEPSGEVNQGLQVTPGTPIQIRLSMIIKL